MVKNVNRYGLIQISSNLNKIFIMQMNITILSLTTYSIFSHSPFFVGNQLTFINGRFSKITSKIFYNQKNLLLKESTFTQIHGSIIHNTNENDRQTIKDIEFSNSHKFNDTEIIDTKSITIYNCQFNSISDEENPFLIKDDDITLYITDTLFNSCRSENGILSLQCRCFTMTHTCSFHSLCNYRTCFLFLNCKKNDFSIILYNSIYESVINTVNNKQVTANIYCSYGDQYLKCNNMTKAPFNGFQFDSVQCFMFTMNTVKDMDLSCLYMSGSNDNINDIKEIETVNFLNSGTIDYTLIRFSSHNYFQFHAKKCVLLSNVKIFRQETTENEYVQIHCYNCIISDVDKSDNTEEIDCTTVQGVDASNFYSLPHFTYGEICPGTKYDGIDDARGCNFGNCIPNNCDRTIGFPDDVVPYTSVFHIDLHTPTFTETGEFSQSADFIYSNKFSKSDDFISSDKFSKSADFTYSDKFSKSNDFTYSKKFSKSADFTHSNIFSETLVFYFTSLQMDPYETSDMTTLFVSNEEIYSSLFSDTKESVIDRDVNLGNGGGKNNKGKMIGIIVGVVGAVAIAAIVTTIVLIRKKNLNAELMSEGDIITQEANVATVENILQDQMDNDDPFAADFDNGQ